MPETNINGAKKIGEEIRNSVERLKIPHETSKTSNYVTVSVGILTFYPERLTSPNEALKLVDDALYKAKENGRNCIVFSNEEFEDSALA